MPFTIIEDKNSYESTESPFVSVDNGQFRGPELKEEWDYEYAPDDSFDADLFNEKQGELIGVTPSRFTEFAVMMPNKEKNIYEPFSFAERRYLKPIYDTPSKRTLLKFGRQSEKTEVVDSIVLLFNGAPIRAGDVKVGDYLATMSTDNSHMTYGRVSWVSKRYNKPCVNIKSRQGHSAKIATTHPMRVWDSWTEAGNIKIANKLAVVRRAGEFFPEFSNKPEYPKHRIRLTAYLIGDGSIGGSNKSGCIGFTQMCGPVLDEFLADIILSGGSYSINQAHKSIAYQVRVHRPGMLRGWMIEDGLMGHTSHTKFIPFWIWGLSREDTALFINRLWSTDGHVKQITKSRYALAYCSVSYRLIRELQSLLWKFGIPSNIRRNWPNYWKEKNIEKYAYILQIETQEGVTKFLRDIGALGKSKGVPLPFVNQNNNRDTYPIEINNLIRNIIKSKGNLGRYSGKSKSLRTFKLRETLKYPPTVDKIKKYVEFFKSDLRYDPVLVAELEKHIDTDLYWDEVEEIIDIGEQECVDFEVEGTHNFICDGFITHNSTMLGNKLLSYSCINTAMNSLYVSPTNMQAKVFSQDRLAEPMATSNYLKSWTTTKLSDSVFLKKFINRSQITLRYAYLNADRCLTGNTRVQLADGSWVTIQEMRSLGGTYSVISADLYGRPMVATATYPRSMGIREVVEICTDYPSPLRCTPDHKILTQCGWVQAQDLTEQDFIAAPHVGGLFSSTTIGEDLAWLIGAMISEGECSEPGSVRFTNTDEEYFLKFRETAERLGIKLGSTQIDNRYPKPCYVVGLYSDKRLSKLNGGKKTLWDIGEFGEKSWDKHIPKAIFCAPAAEKAAFLNALFWGDGWCTEDYSSAEAGYCTSSKKLAEDLCHLLWSLGIRPSIRWKKPSTENAKGSYIIDLSPAHTGCLVGFIGEYRKGLTYKTESGKDYKDRIPVSYHWLREYVKKKYNLSTHSAWIKYKIQLRPDNKLESIGRRVLLSIASKLNDDYLRNLAHPATSWAQVRSVTPCPIHEEVFDLTVEGPESFIANGLVVSNCRGIPADCISLDEIQDILTDNIPVIEECASHSTLTIGGEVHRGGIFMYSGTPKSLDNTLEKYWSEQSTQNEWVVPCHRHSIQTPGGPVTKIYWNILTEDHIGKDSLVCEKCNKPIYPMDPDSKWVSMNAKILKSETIKKPFEGFHVSQLMVPWIKHNDILQKQATYSRDKFYNEVLGESYDSGTRPLTRQDVIENCDERLLLTPEYQEHLLKFLGAAFPVYAGIDWSGGSSGSYTVLSLGAYMGDSRFTIFYVHRFEGKESEPQIQIEEISRLINKFRVQLIGCDYGGGFWPNDELTRRFGFQRIPKYQYAQISTKVMWQDGLKRFLVHRTEVMSDVFNAIKRRNIFRFPNWEQFQSPFGEDCLNIFSEYNEQIRQNVYKKSPNCTDDTFHSIVLCFLASMIRNPRPDIVAPTANAGRTPKPNR